MIIPSWSEKFLSSKIKIRYLYGQSMASNNQKKKHTQKQKHKKHIGISTLHVRVLKENIHIYTCTQMNTHVIKWSTGMREKKI